MATGATVGTARRVAGPATGRSAARPLPVTTRAGAGQAAIARTAGALPAPRALRTAAILVRIAGRTRKRPAATGRLQVARSRFTLLTTTAFFPSAARSAASVAESTVAAVATTAAASAAATVVAPMSARLRHPLDDKIKLTVLLGRGRRILARQHADHAKIVDLTTDDVERVQ